MNLIVLPPQTLRDAQSSPLVLPQELQRTPCAVEVVLWYCFEHLFGELDVSIFVVVVAVPIRNIC